MTNKYDLRWKQGDYHYYENFYTLSYIEKMWGILREEAFPEKIEL